MTPHPTAIVNLDVVYEEAGPLVSRWLGSCETWSALRVGWRGVACETLDQLLAEVSHSAAAGPTARPRGRSGGK